MLTGIVRTHWLLRPADRFQGWKDVFHKDVRDALIGECRKSPTLWKMNKREGMTNARMVMSID
ncbi:hypothetical protein M407DRAFT_31931 [Tulasnella calospora MUT 4182]|uniref:Uncharacterized protein n=1 Tax=Tulasnella calospora MUT 4182 TaxID=1051891 RepID=A0A0C3Q4W7_9AGAM|nr:hypothetical protein M407DRAFT_31931 [Tulasnella calospora MUT 4182]